MRLESIKGLATAAAVAAVLILQGVAATPSLGDEPKGFGRLFRMGGNSSSSPSNSPATPPASSMMTTSPAPASARGVQDYYGLPALSTPPTGPAGGPTGPRITPKPRVNKPTTEADPLVTRVSLGRSDGGGQFGIFLQVYADGTVIDGEGLHKVGPDVLKPVVEAVASGELGKVKGHCGGPAGDFIEDVHVVTYDRSLARLRATSFSYSGNTQGCDHAVHHLQVVLDALQAKLGPAATPAPATAGNSPAPGLLPTPALPLTNLP